jgi:O-acetyl-ADP-ribose deacetylase (regulator of RNase III)
MIKFVAGDIFKTKAQTLVNPVNCLEANGKGLAKEFRDRGPGCLRRTKLLAGNCAAQR